MSNITIEQEEFGEVRDEIFELAREHSKEVDRGMLPEADWDKFEVLDELGNLVIVVARDGGDIIGYLVFIVDNHIHHKSKLFAISDLLYVHPDYRNTRVFSSMVDYSESFLEDLSVDVVLITFKSYADHPELMSTLGFGKFETVYSKILKEDS